MQNFLDAVPCFRYIHFTTVNSLFHDVKSTHLPGPRETVLLDTAALRASFLVESLFTAGELNILLTDMDRLVLGAALPITSLALPACPALRQSFFTERRELGIINIGEPGHVTVNGQRFSLGNRDGLYIGAGHEEITFESGAGSSPCFYFLSCPAHTNLPAVRIGYREVEPELLGAAGNASRRRLRRYIHPGGVASCQLVMGLTELDPGSVWNTAPPHTHERRSEVYLYTGLDENVVVHLMGEPHQTRHLIVRDRQAVLSPSWSVHCGAGTGPYSFIWGMAGENQSFSDMDPVKLHQLR